MISFFFVSLLITLLLVQIKHHMNKKKIKIEVCHPPKRCVIGVKPRIELPCRFRDVRASVNHPAISENNGNDEVGLY